MKQFIFAASALVLTIATADAHSPVTDITMGTALGSGNHAVIVGQPVAGQSVINSEYHLTHGSLQGLIEVTTTGILNNASDIDMADNFRFYPNPTQGVLYIQRVSESEATVDIVSDSGITVVSQSLSQQESAIDLSRLPAGIYFMTITNADNSRHTAKIIKH